MITFAIYEADGSHIADEKIMAIRETPVGAYSGTFYVFRGGSWVNEPWYARVSMRNGNQPRVRSVNLGLRLASDFK